MTEIPPADRSAVDDLVAQIDRPEYPYRRCQDCGGLIEEHDGRRCYDPACPSGPNCGCGINPW